MAKGIIYVMSTCVDGLVKIGKTASCNFEQRMIQLENNGYRRISVLNREFAIEVDDYDEKENLLHELFSKSQVGKTELFSVDINLVKQLMSSLEGKVIYPKDEKKDEIFAQATEVINTKNGMIPNDKYFLKSKIKGMNAYVKAELTVIDGELFLEPGSILAPISKLNVKGWILARDSRYESYITNVRIPCNSPSMAASIVCGHNINGWKHWKNNKGESIDIYRKYINQVEID